MNEFLDAAITVLTLSAWLLSAVFVLGYGLAAPWYRSETGRQLFFSGVVFLEISSLGTATALYGADYYGRPIIRLLVWAQVVAFLLWRNRIFVTAQFRKDYPHGREERNRSESTHE